MLYEGIVEAKPCHLCFQNWSNPTGAHGKQLFASSCSCAHKTNTHKHKSYMKMKISAATLLLLSSSVNIVRGHVVLQGYEDDAYCAPGSCLLYKNPLGLLGESRSNVWKCYDEKTGNTSEAVWTGSKTTVKPPKGWIKNPEKCQDSDKKNKIDPADQQKFADELTTSLYSKPNECTSSLSVSMVFSLLYPGATNDGIAAMRNTF
eukprot:scaffold7749_cov105-Skeletonema_dohrnii-CCMP3373.AAC.1